MIPEQSQARRQVCVALAGLLQAGGEAFCVLLEPSCGDGFKPAAAARTGDLAPEKVDRVQDSSETHRLGNAARSPLGAGVGDGDQMAGQVSAIDRGHIGRVKGPQVRRVVPVVEVTVAPLHSDHGRQGRLKALCGLLCPDPAKIPGAGRRHQVEAKIGRRGALRHDQLGRLLKIVRWQHVACLGDEGLEEAPGLPGDQAQRMCVRFAQGAPGGYPWRQADPECDRWRGDPDQGERGRQRPGTVPPYHGYRYGGGGDQKGAGHPAIEGAEARTKPERRVGGRHPFKQMTTRDGQPHQRSQDGVSHQPRLVRQKDDHQTGLDESETRF